MRRLLVGSLVALALAIGGCAASSEDDADSSEDEVRRGSLLITEEGNNKTFSVEKGKTVKVVLPSNGSTGYQWKVVSTTRSLGYPSPRNGTYDGPGSGGPVGGGGTQTFTWRTSSQALQPSATAHKVKLEYRRSFESDDVPAAKTFTFKLKVKEGPTEPAPTPGGAITIKESQDGATVRAKAGQDVIVRLSQNTSAGYRWYVESTDRTFGYPETSSEGPGRDGPVGSPSTAVMKWKTSGPLSMVGSHTVRLKYSRGENGAASKRFSFTVNIVAVEEDTDFACPPESMRTINCMPIVPAARAQYCAGDYRSWAQDNCDVSYLD